jgi:thiol-disulfide isomerase/thioredoxin
MEKQSIRFMVYLLRLRMDGMRMVMFVGVLFTGIVHSQTVDLKFTSLDGRQVDVQALKGKIVLIDCWASWCAPCLKEMLPIKYLYEKYHDKGFEVIGISMDEASAKERVQQIVAQKDLPWPQRFQGSGFQEDTFRKLYQIKSLPAVFLLDREGNIVDSDARGDRLEPLLKKYLGM